MPFSGAWRGSRATGVGSQVEIEQAPDGGYVYRVGDVARAQSTDLYAVDAEAGAPRPLAAGPYNERALAVSPDGRWVAYVSDESGRNEVHVRPLRGDGRRSLVSRDGGVEPIWSHEGDMLYYRSQDHLMAAEILPTPAFTVRARHRIFPIGAYRSSGYHARFDIMPDGEAFLFEAQQMPGHLVLVLNWFEQLRQRAGQEND